MVISALILVGKTAQLQIFSSTYKNRGIGAGIHQEIIYPSRGIIYDRNKKVLANNFPIYDLKAIYNKVDPNMDTTLFCKLLEISKDEFVENLNMDWRKSSYNKRLPFTFLSKIKPEVFARFQEQLFLFPGFYPSARSIRAYPHTYAAHQLGYLGEVDSTDIANSSEIYTSGDYIGQSGLERYYESQLRGRKGTRYILKDNVGREVGKYNEGNLDSLAQVGEDLIVTLDLDLQSYGEQLMQNKRGSIVAIEPSTGEIICSLSAPSYDPNVLNLDRNRGKAFNQLLYDSINKINRPLLDRSVMAKYPPGSIFKPIFSLIALQEGTTYINRTIHCDGEYNVNKNKGFVQGCHNHPTPYNIQTALQHSCNSYYYQLMREFIEKNGYSKPGEGLRELDNYLYKFGLGKKLGIDYSHENSGSIPTPEYYDAQYSYVPSGWKSSYILSIGIGQGELELTTMQMANLAVILANRGYYHTPHFVSPFSKFFDARFLQQNKVPIEEKYFHPIIDGMQRVITSGTAQAAYVRGLDICGKTGTSQNPHGKDHSVFFAFAPKDDPKIAIAVYVENAGFGGNVAAPIASLMIEKYLNKEISPWRLQLEERLSNFDLISLPH